MGSENIAGLRVSVLISFRDLRDLRRDNRMDSAAPRPRESFQPGVAATSRSQDLRISSPPDGATYLIDPTLRREFQALALRAVTSTPGSVEWMVDERSLGPSDSDSAASWPLTPGRHTFRVRNAVGQIAAATIVVH